MSKESIETLIDNEVELRVAAALKEAGASAGAVNTDGLPGVVCRCYNAGVIAGYLKSEEPGRIELVNSRYCLSFSAGKVGSADDLAKYGPSGDGKIQAPRHRIISGDSVEIIYATKAAMAAIMAAPEA